MYFSKQTLFDFISFFTDLETSYNWYDEGGGIERQANVQGS